MLQAVLRSHPSRGLFKKKTAKVWSPVVSVSRRREKRNPQLRGETSARLMRRTAVRQPPSSLRLWCLSMLNTHSMIQNILKYGTVIIDLQNTHPHVLGIYILHFFFRSRGSRLPRRQNCLKAFCLCLHILTQEVCWARCLFFTLSNDDRRARIIILIQHCYLRLRLIIVCLHV